MTPTTTEGIVLVSEVTANTDDPACYLAVVDLSPEKIKYILNLHDQCFELQKTFPDLDSIHVWDYQAEWILPEYETDASPEEDIKKVSSLLVKDPGTDFVAISQEEYADLSPHPLVTMRSECNQLVVTTTSFYWTCVQKHTSQEYATVAFPISIL